MVLTVVKDASQQNVKVIKKRGYYMIEKILLVLWLLFNVYMLSLHFIKEKNIYIILKEILNVLHY